METKKFRVYAAYRQFYLADDYLFKYADGPDFVSEMWTREAFSDRMAVQDGVLGIITGSYGFVEVQFEMHAAAPDVGLEEWDHVVEGSLEIVDGELQLVGCMGNEAARLAITPDWYRVRCCQTGLASVKDSGGECPDWYRIQMWPAEPAPVLVLKSTSRAIPKEQR